MHQMTSLTTDNSLGKSERIKSFGLINQLFSSGNSLFVHPLKAVYLPLPKDHKGHDNHLFGVSVPKRKHKKANVRNLLKRRVREAYRQNKPKSGGHYQSMAIMYILIDAHITDYVVIEKAMVRLNRKLDKVSYSEHS